MEIETNQPNSMKYVKIKFQTYFSSVSTLDSYYTTRFRARLRSQSSHKVLYILEISEGRVSRRIDN